MLAAIPAAASRSHHNFTNDSHHHKTLEAEPQATLKTTKTRTSTAKASTRKVSDVPRSCCYWLRRSSRWPNATSLVKRKRLVTAGLASSRELARTLLGRSACLAMPRHAVPAQSRSSFSTVPVRVAHHRVWPISSEFPVVIAGCLS